jgi:hypothetical protein
LNLSCSCPHIAFCLPASCLLSFLQPSSSNNSSSAAAAGSSGNAQQQQQQQPLAMLLGGKPLSPSCMNGIVATFNPRRAAQQQQAGANGKLDFKAAASINAIVEQVRFCFGWHLFCGIDGVLSDLAVAAALVVCMMFNFFNKVLS